MRAMRSERLLLLLLLLVLASACGDSSGGEGPAPDSGTPDSGTPDGGLVYRDECENINPMDCLLPWPSSRYLVDDATTATGKRIAIPVEAMPTNKRGVQVDPSQFARFDGFSPATSMMTSFAGEIDASALPDEAHIEASLGEGSPTVVLDATTGERVAHFAELDSWPVAAKDELRRPLYIRPAARLEEGRRYIVAVRGLEHTDGTPVEPSDYFRALRDGTPLEGATDLEARREHFESIFSALEAAGVAREGLVEAWDFETASGPSIYGELLAMRDAALLAVEADDEAPRCTVTSVVEDPETNVAKRIEGTVRVPLFLNGTDPEDTEACRVHRDAEGHPVQNGWADVPFTLNVPTSLEASLAEGGAPGRLIDYGHGLLGSRNEGNSGWFRDTLEANQMIGVAIDWWGMSTPDLGRVATALGEFSLFPTVTERLGQSLINHVVLHRSFRGGCAELAELQFPGGDGAVSAIDPAQIYYYGNSQGGIMGLALAGLAVDVDRFVIGVGGMTYSVMITRSANWQTYGTAMKVGYGDPLVRALLMVMAQSQWDIGEASTFVPHILEEPLPCDAAICPSGLTPVKRLLFQIAKDDPQVATVTAELAARTMGLPYVTPAAFTPWGLDTVEAAMGEVLGESALAIFAIPGTPVLPLGTRDPGKEENPAHEGVRRSPAAIEQIDLFLRPDGHVVQTCDGVCDPT
jgi:hypothetical protein